MKMRVIGAFSVVIWGFLVQDVPAFYNPSTGRWLSRDRIGEKGGKNLYGFCGNSAIGNIDYLGQSYAAVCNPGTLVVGAGGVAAGIASLPVGAIVTGVVIVGAVVYITYKCVCRPRQKRCRPCIPEVGTVGGRVDPGGGHGTTGPYHLHYAQMNQVPLNTPPPGEECRCFWNMDYIDPINWPVPWLPPGIVGIAPAAGGGVEWY